MEIKLEDDGKKGRFYVLTNNVEEAQMTFTWAGTDRIIIDHTEVNDSLRGTGAGKQMVLKAVELPVTKGLKSYRFVPLRIAYFKKRPKFKTYFNTYSSWTRKT